MNSKILNLENPEEYNQPIIQKAMQEIQEITQCFKSKHCADDEFALQHHFTQKNSAQQSSASPLDKMSTGMLRYDIKLIPGGTDINGQECFMLFDPVSDNYYRLSKENKRILELITEEMILSKFMEKLRRYGVNTTPENVIALVGFLHQSNLTLPIAGSTHSKIVKAQELAKNMRLKMLLSSYLFFRVPLVKPDKFLDKTAGAIKSVFNKWMLLSLILFAVIGYICVIFNFHKLSNIFIKSISVKGLIRYSTAIVVIKIVHEFAHAYATKLAGCRVRRMGIAIVFFVPRLYSDLTDAWRVSSRKKRFLIDGAGIISELIIGGLAALIWANTMTGTTKTVAYYVFAVSILNTIFVNGNPLIRYDGYYMLMDLLNVDNLQKRSIEMMKYIRHRFFFGIEGKIPDGYYTNARISLVIYGIGAYIYRIFLYSSIIAVVYFQFTKALGIILLFLEVYVLMIMPLQMEIKQLVMLRKKMKRKNVIFTTLFTGLIIAVFIIPLPWSIDLPCITQSNNSSFVYTQVDGILKNILVKDGDKLNKGAPIIELENPDLKWNLEKGKHEEQIAKLKLDSLTADVETLSLTTTQKMILKQVKDNIKEVLRKQKLLINYAQNAGTFSLYDRKLKMGKWLPKGTLIGEVFSTEDILLNAYIVESDYNKIKKDDKVTFSLDDDLTKYQGTVTAVLPVPTQLRPSPLLQPFGGPILCNKTSATTYNPLQQYYVVKICPAEKDQKNLPNGRTGTVTIRKYSSLATNIMKNALNIINKELSF